MLKTAKKTKKILYKEFNLGLAIFVDFSKGVNPWFWVKIEKLSFSLYFFQK